jgi:hypothetical protein
MEEKYLGRFALDAETRQLLGSQNLGVFIGECGGLEKTVEHLKNLDEASADVLWLVVVATKKMNAAVYKMLKRPGSLLWIDPKKVPAVWSAGHLIVTTPEGLSRMRPERLLNEYGGERKQVTAILVIDMLCNLHKARGDQEGFQMHWKDRPQEIANFRSALAGGRAAPPILIFTQQRAKSIETVRLVSTYCLDAMWFLDGRSLSCEKHPAAQAVSAAEDNHHAMMPCLSEC